MTMQKWERAVKERDNRTCLFCGSKQKIEAHHIKQRKDRPDLALIIDNGITLCHDCHLRAHGGCYNPGAKPMNKKYSSEYCEPVIEFVRNRDK